MAESRGVVYIAWTAVEGIDESCLEWEEHEGFESLTLRQIFEQAKAITGKEVPSITVTYELGLWGVIFSLDQCFEHEPVWVVGGITKGYA